eukprot:c9645_g1_i1.p2 GENE.c9645_g1_i1~~c9645_g1_i1.p2  ORF type:complete len:138 (+),score=34.21 c9645_g1_i1:740-1153(+)
MSVFCCVGALALGSWLDRVDVDRLGWFLCERQVNSGGFNGRPEKLADVCYSWWVLSSLALIKRQHWIDQDKLKAFIFECQDDEGGISDKPGNMVDLFHTFFGVAGLSLLGHEGLVRINPAFAMTDSTLEACGIPILF